jgi:TonB-linked SusC/RagA family outer membrane protein
MKIKLALLLCAGNIHAATLYSQQSTLSVSWENRTIVSILDELKRDTGYEFFYRKGLIPDEQRTSVAMREATITQVLDGVLARNGYAYDIRDNVVLINRAAQPAAQQPQAHPLRGRVTATDGTPLRGASVAVKGAAYGTTTDATGAFVINIPADNRVLTVSFIGYRTREINVGDRTELSVTLEESAASIDEVVITGYNVIDKALYTGSMFQLKPDTTVMRTVTSIEDMLQGTVPGMTVINTSGLVGAAPRVRIRGTSTLYGNQSPLWVVDGVIQRDPLPIPEGTGALGESDLDNLREVASSVISWLNPMDIETITVLKDAASTAIYGSQASNGVIVITTKKARSGGFTASYSGSFSAGQRPRYSQYDMMNSQELMAFSQEMYVDRNTFSDDLLPIGYAEMIRRLQNKEITRQEFDREFRYLENMNTDWFDILFRSQLSQIHNVSVTGGGEKVTNRVSLGVQRILGEARGNDMTNFTANSTTTIRLGDKLMANVVVSGSNSERSGYAFDVDPFSYAMNTSRTTPLYNPDGSLHYHAKTGLPSTAIAGKRPYYMYNILNELDNTSNRNATQTLQTSFDISWKFGNGFDLRGMFAYALANSEVRSHATEYSHYITQLRGYEQGEAVGNPLAMQATPLPFGGVSINEDARNRDWSTRVDINYNRVFGELHTVLLQLGGEARSARTFGHKDTAFGYLHYRGEKYAGVPLAPINIAGAAEHNPANNLHTRMRMGTYNKNAINNYLSTYLTAIYSYDRRYTVNLNARLDASNRFGQDKNKRFEPNWSAGLKWRLAEERFVTIPWWMDMLDLSVSYGYAGNAVQVVSPYLIAIDKGFDEYYQHNSLGVRSLPYPDLGWEKKRDLNAGIDLSFFEGRVGLTASLFRSTSDVLNERDIPLENGQRSGVIMGQKMENRGWDINVNVTPVRTGDWLWSLTFNTGKSKSKMERSEQVNDRDMYLGGMAVVDGQPYSTFWSYSYKGLDGVRGYPTFNYMDIEPTANPLDYLVRSGKFEPDFQGGFSTMVRYKELTMRALFSMSMGAHGRLPRIYNAYGAPALHQNAPRLLNDRWRKPGDENRPGVMPALPVGNKNAVILKQLLPADQAVEENRFAMWHLSDARVASSDFIRCRNISLSYNLPEQWVREIAAGNASLSMVVSNPFIIAFDDKWDGYDPETGNWPLRKTVTFNLSLSF